MANRSRDKTILAAFCAVGVLLFPVWTRKPPLRDWLITYFQTGLLATFIDSFFIQQKRLLYPTRLLRKSFGISVLFDYLLFPTIAVLYNQVTYKSSVKGIIGKVFLFSVPITILEYLLERHTTLITWKKWKWYHTLISVTSVTLMGRLFLAVIRRVSPYQPTSKRIPIASEPDASPRRDVLTDVD